MKVEINIAGPNGIALNALSFVVFFNVEIIYKTNKIALVASVYVS